MKSLFLDIGELAHMVHPESDGALRGSQMSDRDALVVDPGCAILVEDGRISKITDSDSMRDEFSIPKSGTRRVHQAIHGSLAVWHCSGLSMTPGFIDSHAHLVWAGDRSHEATLRKQGLTYQQIADQGGGIGFTVNQTKESSFDSLVELTSRRLGVARRNGTVAIESKSGYGLSTEAELKILEVSNHISEGSPLEISHTWLGAHAVPADMDQAEFVDYLISDQLPEVVSQGIATSCDVFCEVGWFTVEETERICLAAKEEGLDIRLHVDEFQDSGGAQLAADLGARSADHAGWSDEEARENCTKAGVNQGFLPGTPYVLGSDHWPPMREAVEKEWIWSLASDYNPNCQSLSLPFAGSLAMHRCGISALEALTAVTVNAAATLDSNTPCIGTIQEGGLASFNLLSTERVDGWCQTPGQSSVVLNTIRGQTQQYVM